MKIHRVVKRSISVLFLLFFLTQLVAQSRADALVLYRQKKYTAAIEICRAEIAESPKNLDSYVVLGWALNATKHYEEAFRQASNGRKISHYDPRLIAIQGEARFYAGKNKDALEYFQEYVSYAPNGTTTLPHVYFFMGEIYLRLAHYHHADIALTTAVHLDRKNSLWWERLGYAREKSYEYTLAVDAYNQALTLNKNSENARRGRERVLKRFARR